MEPIQTTSGHPAATQESGAAATGVSPSNPPGSNPASPGTMGAGPGGLPTVEEILQKRAGGIKLTKAEAGRLSQVGRRNRRQAQQAASRAGGQVVDNGMDAAGQGALPDVPPVDETLCKDTAGEILDTLNEAGMASIDGKLIQLDPDPSDARKFRDMAALKPGARTTMVNTAPRWLPKLLRVAGLDAANAPEAMAGVAAMLWGIGFVRSSSSLDKLIKQKPEEPNQADGAKPA